MFYGSLAIANTQHPSETEKSHVTRMMAATGTFPWQAESLCTLAGSFGTCTLAVHAGEGRAQPSLLPTFAGLTIAADVRLDNRGELCDALGINAAERPTLGDADLILRAYRRWGTDCAAHLLGDFAFAVWDQINERLFCARDVVGARPFYYHYAKDRSERRLSRFVFAGDLRAIVAHPLVPTELNLAYLVAAVQTTTGQFQHPDHTYYRAIDKLPPAHCLTLDADGVRRWAYWQPDKVRERRYADERDYVEELRELLQAAVACRIEGTHPVGAHISGGLDSSSVAVLAHRMLGDQGRAFTGFSWAPPLPEDPADLVPNDERKLVEAVREAEGMSVHYTRLAPKHILALARRDLTLQPTTTLQFELAASEDAASLGIRTMLSGWGGDELAAFNGRGYFSDLLRRGRWLTLQREFTKRGRLHGGAVWKQWIASGLFPLLPSAILRRVWYSDAPQPSSLPPYLRPAFAAALADVEPLTRPDLRERPGVHRMQIALLQHGHLGYRMESWAGHGATLGITYAFPLLDQRIVEFALSIPDYLFFKNGWKRYLYRTAMQGILPDRVRWQKVKEDPAMAQGGRAVHEETDEQLRADLLAQADNPYVDVEQLQAAIDAEQDDRATILDDDLSQRDRRRLRQQLTATHHRWLAFINPTADLPA